MESFVLMKLMYIVLITILYTQEGKGLNVNEFEEVRTHILNYISRDQNSIPTLVRLGFHDCKGGCDGCLNLNDQDNSGLGRIYRDLNNLYENENLNTILSRADFIAFSSSIAVLLGARNQQNCQDNDPNCHLPPLTFKWGRVDCPTSPFTTEDDRFPNGHGGYDHVMKVFRDEMGFTEKEIVALMGAHTLGRARTQNSGFSGPWAPPTTTFSNKYYRELTDTNNRWTQNPHINDDSVKYQWDSEGNRKMMLNTDMCLYKKIEPNADGIASCPYTSCPMAQTASFVDQYADNNELWMNDFAQAWDKLLKQGYEELEDICNEENDANEENPSSSPICVTSEMSFTVPPNDNQQNLTEAQKIIIISTAASFSFLAFLVIFSLLCCFCFRKKLKNNPDFNKEKDISSSYEIVEKNEKNEKNKQEDSKAQINQLQQLNQTDSSLSSSSSATPTNDFKEDSRI